MPITEERVEKLRGFGLSEYAARAYLALLDLGVSEARDISNVSRVPQSKIYHVLEQLHEKGLVSVLPEFPKKYAPVAFVDFLDRLHDEHAAAARSIAESRDALAEAFRVLGETDLGDRGDFSTLRGRRNVLDKIVETIDATRSDLVLLGTHGLSARTASFMAELERARARGARLRVLVPVTPETVEALVPLASVAEVRSREVAQGAPGSNVSILISDASQSMLITHVPDDANPYSGKDVGIVTDQQSMVAAMQALVEREWEQAEPYASRALAIRTGRGPEFTRVYTSVSDVREAFMSALDSNAAEFCHASAIPAELPAPEDVAALDRLLLGGRSARALVNLTRIDVAEAYLELARTRPGLEIRHVDPSIFGRFSLLQGREAFVAMTRPTGRDGRADAPAVADTVDLTIHTTNESALRSLADYFEAQWARGTSLEKRRLDLERFPEVHPREIGFGALVESLRDAVIVAEARTGRIVLWNPAAQEIFGFSAQEAVGQPVSLIVPLALRERHEAGLRRFAETRTGAYMERGEVLDLPALTKSGKEISIELTLNRVPVATPKPLVVAIARDVTARKRADLELAERERQLAEAQRIARVGSWAWNVSDNAVTWSATLCEIFGVTPQEFGASYEGFLTRIHPEDRDRVRETIERALRTGEDFAITHRILRPSGEARLVHGRGTIVPDARGAPARLVGTTQDVTDVSVGAPEVRLTPTGAARTPRPGRSGARRD